MTAQQFYESFSLALELGIIDKESLQRIAYDFKEVSHELIACSLRIAKFAEVLRRPKASDEFKSMELSIKAEALKLGDIATATLAASQGVIFNGQLPYPVWQAKTKQTRII
ncbi:MAG: hypothetical protein FWE37_00080 [Spirochaetaceae bacterium]|nr:hypothetical protein [Spirochaetaceae bacterium]